MPGEVRFDVPRGGWPSAEIDGLESALPRLSVQLGVELQASRWPPALDTVLVTHVTVTRRDPRPEHDAAAAACLIEQVRLVLAYPLAAPLDRWLDRLQLTL